MGRMAEKRKTKKLKWLEDRVSHLKSLAANGDQAVREEWNQHLEWIARTMQRQAFRLSGTTTCSTVDHALTTLRRVVPAVSEKEIADSARDLKATAVGCVARAAGPTLNRLTLKYETRTPKHETKKVDRLATAQQTSACGVH